MKELYQELSYKGYSGETGDALFEDFTQGTDINIGSRDRETIDSLYFMNGRFVYFQGHYGLTKDKSWYLKATM